MRVNRGWIVLVIVGAGFSAFAEEKWFPYPVEVWDPAFDMESPRKQVDYAPLEKASKKWHICVFFPHMKDAYWLAVDYGVVSEAKRLGIRMTLRQAGGYDNLETQIAQIRECLASGADGIVIGAISYDGLNDLVAEVREKGIPVIDVINGMSSDRLSGKSLVSFGEMGYKAGEYIARRHPEGSRKVRVAWFPGPKDAGWVQAGDKGFREAVAKGAIEIVDTRYGDTGKQVQGRLVEEALDAHGDIDYIVGTAVTAEAAVRVLRKRKLDTRTKVMAYYFTPGVYRGIRRGKILGSPTDSAVIQGRVAMDQVVRILEKKEYLKHVGPRLYVIDGTNINTFERSTSLAPDGFRATYTVN